MRQSYLKNAALMTGADVLLRLAGMGLRIYLANALGGEGMGLYQLVLAVYALFVTLATAGVSVAATRLMAEELSRGRAEARGLLARLLAAVLADTALSEAVSACMMLLFYHREARRCFAGEKARRPRDPARRLWDILWPVEGGRCLASALHTAENMLVPACLALALGAEGGRAAAVAQYGSLKGMALPLLTFPFGLLGSLSVLLMPEITQAHIRGETARLQALIDRMLRLTGYFSALAGAVFWVLGCPLAQTLYHSPEAGFYLEVLGPAMPLLYFESMVDGAMKGMGEQKAAFRYSVWDSILRIVGVVLLLPRYGMPGFLFVILVSSCYTCLANTGRLLASSETKPRLWRWLGAPMLASAGAAAVGVALRQGLAGWFAGALLPRLGALALCAGGMSAVYLVAAWPLGLGEEVRAALAKKH